VRRHFGLRWQAQRDTAFARTRRVEISKLIPRPKAPSPLRSAGAVQNIHFSWPIRAEWPGGQAGGGLAKQFCQCTGVCYAAAMRILSGIFTLALALTASSAEIRFDFNNAPEGSLPAGFMPVLKGGGQPGIWKTVSAEVPSGFATFSNQVPIMNQQRVLAQTSVDMTDERFPLLLFTGEKFRNFKVTTQFKIVGGIAEQMAGMVFRYQNASNYYVVRASALGNNVRFYKVVGGQRSNPIGPTVNVTAGEWHTLTVQCDGTQISFWFDGRLVMPPLGDNSLNEGLLGFCTKSDAVACFTGTTVSYTPIVPGAQHVVNKILENQTRLLGLRIYTLQTNGTTSVIASKDHAEIGNAGTEAELKAIQEGTISFGREKGTVLVTMPLHDRNGENIAAVRVKLKSFWGETQDTAVNRARLIVKEMQAAVSSGKDLE
jgi:hypothetical protein